jgi:serine/threonine-protein kinase
MISHAASDFPVKIGRYEILGELGQGAMGTVYRARDPLIERTVAIKTVSIALLQQEGADAESRFLREAQSAGRLSHPTIVTIYDVGEADGLAYIAMEYLPGASLRDVMDRGPIPLDLALDTAIQMSEALSFAHEHGVIHRDIKPSNVVLTGQRGRIKITDFGIAHLVNSNHTRTGQMLGSPRYMSPEQAMGREIDGRSDIFSLGAVLYEMLTGCYAFDGDSLPTIVYRVINEMPPPATSLQPRLPAALGQLLARMLNKNPESRPDAHTLLNILQTMTPEKPARVTPASMKKVPFSLPLVAFGTPFSVFLLIGIGFIVIEYFLPEPPQPNAISSPVAERSATGARPRLPAAPASPPDADPGNAAGAAGSQPADKPASATDPYLAGLDKKRVELRIKRTELLLDYTAQHPDVVLVDRQLEQLHAERSAYLRQMKRR